jgi:hypothetical protein
MSELVDRRCVDELEEKVIILQAELLALREKYSTKHEMCDNGVIHYPGDIDTECPDKNCTNGRVMMLDAEGVKSLADKQVDKWVRDALLCILKGGSQ